MRQIGNAFQNQPISGFKYEPLHDCGISVSFEVLCYLDELAITWPTHLVTVTTSTMQANLKCLSEYKTSCWPIPSPLSDCDNVEDVATDTHPPLFCSISSPPLSSPFHPLSVCRLQLNTVMSLGT